MSFRGALPDGIQNPESLAVIDIGGGSTEIVGMVGKDSDRLFRFSFEMGCVRLTERFLATDPPVSSQIHELRAFVKTQLNNQPAIINGLRGRALLGVAGTVTYLASSALGLGVFNPDRVHGYSLGLAAVQELVKRFSGLTAADRLGVGGMDKGRADVILAGALILEEVMLAAGIPSISASVRGLRYGAVLTA